jgi:hypothetical protein
VRSQRENRDILRDACLCRVRELHEPRLEVVLSIQIVSRKLRKIELQRVPII